jgi:hypothetical protein
LNKFTVVVVVVVVVVLVVVDGVVVVDVLVVVDVDVLVVDVVLEDGISAAVVVVLDNGVSLMLTEEKISALVNSELTFSVVSWVAVLWISGISKGTVDAVDGSSGSSTVESGKFCTTADADCTGTVALGAMVTGLLFRTVNAFWVVLIAPVCQGYTKFVTFCGRVFPWAQVFLPQHLMIFTLLAAINLGLFDLAATLELIF